MRVPFIARWHSRIPPGRVTSGFASTLDLMPTLGNLARTELPRQPLDGTDIWSILAGHTEDVEREAFLYFDGFDLQCARIGRWKLHLARYNSRPWGPDPVGGRISLPLYQPELYDLSADPEETSDVSEDNPDVVRQIRARIDSLLPTFPPRILAQYYDTHRRHVNYHPAGALPVERTP